MTKAQIVSCCTNHRPWNKKYYADFLWGGRAIKNRPSSQDIISIISEFYKCFGSTMYAPYAERIAIVELNP